MDKIEIPGAQVHPMDAVAEGVHGLRIVFVNVFGITHPNRSWTLIDAGLPFSEGYIRSWSESHFTSPPNAIVLTHGHFDHVSSAAALADHWKVPVYAHFLEHPYLTGQKEYPAPNVLARGGMTMPALLSPFLPRGPVDLGLRLLEFALPGEPLEELPGWQILHTPGHTPGHVSLFRPVDRVLLPGDAFCTTEPESFFEAALVEASELHGPPAYFSWNWTLARLSVQMLSTLDPLVIAPGHGKPLAGHGVPEALRQLAAGFTEIAVPKNENGTAA